MTRHPHLRLVEAEHEQPEDDDPRGSMTAAVVAVVAFASLVAGFVIGRIV